MRALPPLLPQSSRLLLILLVLALSSLGVRAQVPGAQDPPTIAEVEKRIEAIQADPALDAARKTAAVEVLQQALAKLKELPAIAERVSEFEAKRTSAPATLVTIQGELSKPPVEPVVGAPENASATVLEKGLSIARAEEAAATKTLEELRQEPGLREERRKLIPTQMAAEKKRIGDIDELLKAEVPAGESPELSDAKSLRRRVMRAEAHAKLKALESELASYDSRGGLLEARIQLAEREKARAEKLVRAWKTRYEARLEAEAKRARVEAEEARKAAQAAHAVVRGLTDRNVALTRRTAELTTRYQRATKDQDRARSRLEELETHEKDVKKRIETIGLTDAIGALLRQDRVRLGEIRELRERMKDRRREISGLQLEQIEINKEVEQLRNFDELVAELLAESPQPIGEDERPNIDALVRERLQIRQGYIEDFSRGVESCINALVLLDSLERQVVSRSETYAAFIDEHVLWIRSTLPIWEMDAGELGAALEKSSAAPEWKSLGGALTRSFRRRSVEGGFLLAALLSLLGARLIVPRRVFASHVQAGKGISFSPTMKTLLASLLRALPAPATCWCAGFWLREYVSGAWLAYPLGTAFQSVGVLAGVLLGVRQLLRGGGLGESHFGWRPTAVQLVRRVLFLFTPFVLASGFLLGFVAGSGNEVWISSVGRLATILYCAVIGAFVIRVLHPHRGLLAPEFQSSNDGWLARFRWTWFLAATGLPISLAVLAILGYQYTAQELLNRLESTAAIVMGLIVVNALILRALVIARRKLRIKQASEKREAAAEAGSPDPTRPSVQELDIVTVDAQSRQLLQSALAIVAIVGIWLVWADVVPAFRGMLDVTVGSYAEDVVQTVTGSDGVARSTTVTQSVPVTLADVVIALLLLIPTFLAVKNIPGVLEVLLLQRLPIHQSSRYAISTVVRYVIAIVGSTYALGQLGFTWSKLQWLIAAMGVGLGFGLQEVFGNFVCGLILLFERRIRVGDVITVGDVSGVVTRVRVLATIVRDWDRKEFVVPNKDVITGRLSNWTLSNAVNRVIITIGLAYGSDTQKAREIMLSVAAAHKKVLDDPSPVATFDEFADSTLTCRLRCFLPDLTGRLEVISQLHEALDARFKEAGLEIAFPQRDLHLRTLPAGATLAPPVEKSEAAGAE